MLDFLNAQQIEELLQEKQRKAEAYAAQPERFTLFSLELEIRTDHGKHLVLYLEGLDIGPSACSEGRPRVAAIMGRELVDANPFAKGVCSFGDGPFAHAALKPARSTTSGQQEIRRLR